MNLTHRNCFHYQQETMINAQFHSENPVMAAIPKASLRARLACSISVLALPLAGLAGPGAGNRPYTDFDTANCTNVNCERRAAYLKVAADLLVADLEEMVANWADDGAARAQVMEAGDKGGLAMILTGMGSLSYGELAGERMKLGLLLHDPEEEHDCFSDNTHVSHLNDVLGIRNVYTGQYERVDGTMVEGPAIADLVAAKAPDIDKEIRADLDDSVGFAVQAGFDVDITERFFFNADVKYIDIDTTATLRNATLGTQQVDIDLDPFVFGIGIGFRL